MSTVKVLESVKEFLERNVADRIRLQKPSDNDVYSYELVHPRVHIGWIPPEGFLPPEMECGMPCLIVGMDDGTDSGAEASINIRVSAAVYSPGTHKPDGQGGTTYTPDFSGYNDLLNLIDLAVAELMRQQILGGGTVVQMPVKWGMYKEQPYPYWYGHISFEAKKEPLKYVPKDIERFL